MRLRSLFKRSLVASDHNVITKCPLRTHKSVFFASTLTTEA